MDPTTIAMLIALGTLLVERSFSMVKKIKRSKCFQFEIDFKDKQKDCED